MKKKSSEEQQLSSASKVAAFMIALGQENAAEVYKYLREDEVEKLSLEIANIDKLNPEQLQAIMDEFYDLCVAQKIIAEGGKDYAYNVLIKAFGEEKAKSLIKRVDASGKTRAFAFLKKVDYKSILMLLQNELPQTIALVLSHINSKKAAQIIAELPHETQVEIFQRIADLDRTSPEVLHSVEAMMEEKLSSVTSVDTAVDFGGMNYLAEVMNNLDTRTEKLIMEDLTQTSPELVEEIQKRMFVFDDIVYLDNLEIQTFIRECDSKELTIALKGSNPEVVRVILSNMSQRQQETIKTDMQYLHNVRMRDVEEAQRSIIATIRRLEETGDIVISKGGMDEIIP
ncbi:MAG: flagellar motor switch protein FliG [Oscillospiraceae bacterium]